MAELMRFPGSLPETTCGAGSKLINTTRLRAELRPMLDRLGIKSIVDAPCGDFNWMRCVNLDGIDYIGLDNSPENIGRTRGLAPGRDFREFDIIAGKLPQADAVLCRDFLQHIPTAAAIKALSNMAGSKWLIATSHDVKTNEDLKKPKRFRCLNLMKEPFCMGEPVDFIVDWPGRILGAWAWPTT